jgi:hypothetical protein
MVSGVVGSENESLAVVGCLPVEGIRCRMSSILLAVMLLSLLLLCVELLKMIRARRHCSTDGCWGAYLVLGGI